MPPDFAGISEQSRIKHIDHRHDIARNSLVRVGLEQLAQPGAQARASSNHMSTYLSPHSGWLSASKNRRGKGDVFKAPLPGKVVESSALRTTEWNQKELGLPHTSGHAYINPDRHMDGMQRDETPQHLCERRISW